jgi:hypothetical protein
VSHAVVGDGRPPQGAPVRPAAAARTAKVGLPGVLRSSTTMRGWMGRHRSFT